MGRYSKKQAKKRFDNCCFFCKEENYNVLDAHRILPGSEGGTYDERNTITACSNCHRKIHSGEITIDKKYLSTAGCYMLHCWIDNNELWLPCYGYYFKP